MLPSNYLNCNTQKLLVPSNLLFEEATFGLARDLEGDNGVLGTLARRRQTRVVSNKIEPVQCIPVEISGRGWAPAILFVGIQWISKPFLKGLSVGIFLWGFKILLNPLLSKSWGFCVSTNSIPFLLVWFWGVAIPYSIMMFLLSNLVVYFVYSNLSSYLACHWQQSLIGKRLYKLYPNAKTPGNHGNLRAPPPKLRFPQ